MKPWHIVNKLRGGLKVAAVRRSPQGLAPDAATKLTELKAIPDSYRKRQFIEAGGWATMPGQTSADSRVAEGCSTALSV